jgi:hypothetical protein
MQQSVEKPDSQAAAGTPPVTAVAATPGGLLRATLGAAAVAAALVTLFWLPAEHGIDPTGLGGVMGLTRMGEIKQQLYTEAAADAAAETAAALAPRAAVSDPELLRRLEAIEAQVSAIALALQATTENPGAAPSTEPASDPAWRDEVSYTLAPGEGVELKLVMQAGEVAEFYWTANGAVLNHDTHGHGSGQRITYERGRGVAEQQAQLEAAFTGKHGWFWRNRGEAPVTLTLRTRGQYSELQAP